MIVRQGDVILRRTRRRHPKAEAVEHVLAVGEESGHWHAVVGRLAQVGDRRFVTLDKPAQLRVEGQPDRHTPVDLPAGTWEVLVEREYVPGQLPRTVAD